MISSLQQLHSRATHSRNFLSNFQVARSEQQTRGRVFSARKGTEEGEIVLEASAAARNERRKRRLVLGDIQKL